MNKFINVEKIMAFLSIVFDLLLLNFIFIIMCLPIVTIGANITAVYCVTFKMSRDEGYYVLKDYFKSFKNNFKQATIVLSGIFIWFIFVLLELSLYIRLESENLVLAILILFSLVLLLMITVYTFPLISSFHFSVCEIFVISVMIAVKKLPYTILIICLSMLPLFLILFFQQFIGIYMIVSLFCGFSLMFLFKSYILKTVFLREVKIE